MADEIIIETTSTEVVEVGVPGPQGPAGAAGTGLETLTTQGDTLYRGASTGERLPIGTTGQILKVSAQGLPTWANESGAVTSVNGATGAVTVAAATHATRHEAGNEDELQATSALVATDVVALNGVYFWDGTTTSGRPNFFKTGTRKNTKIVYNATTLQWNLVRNTVIEAIGTDGPSTVPWGQETWEDTRNPAQVTNITVTRLPLETMVQKLAETGGAATATTSEDGLMSSSDKTKLNGISSGAEVNVQSNWTEADSNSDAFIQNKPSTFAPSSHSSSHASAGSDPLAPSDIGAQSLFAAGVITGASSPAAARAIIYDVMNFGSAYDITLPITNSLQGDIFVFRATNLMAANVTIKFLPTTGGSQTVGTLTAVGEQLRFTYRASAQEWILVEVDSHPANRITSGTLTHERGGLEADVSAYNGLVKIASGSTSAVGIGTGSTEVAAGDHVHGNITSDGKIGSTAGLPVVTTTAGAMTTLALGTANQILRVNSGASGVEFADPSGGGVTAVGASTADVLSVSGSDLVADDGGTIDSSDPFIKWDDVAGKLVYANPLSRPSGAFYVGLAPSTTALGTNAINIQSTRTGATNVASGSSSICIGTGGNTASGQESISIGVGNAVSALRATAVGYANTASGQESIALGSLGFASGVKSVGVNETAVLRGQVSLLPFRSVYWGGQTTNATATILNLDATATNRFTIAANTALAVDILLVARRSDTQDKWLVARRFLGIRRDGSNNTSLIGSVQTLGTDQTDGSPTWSFTLTADDTNEALQLEVTGAASETVQWRATAFYRFV